MAEAEGSRARSGLPVGLNKGRKTEKRELKPKPSYRKGRSTASRKLVTGVIRDVAGFAPYERRVMELIRNSKDKKARKLVKRRLGTLKRAKRKVEDLTNVIAEARRAGH